MRSDGEQGGVTPVHVLMPCFNEQDSVMSMVDALVRAFAEESQFHVIAVFIDDGSQDDTWDQVKRAQERLLPITVGGVRLDHNQGKASAQAVGLRQVAASQGLVVLMDSDGQHDPTHLPDALRASLRSGIPYVARRTVYRRGRASTVGTAGLSILSSLTGVRFDPSLGEYIVLPSRTARLLARNPQLGVVPIVSLIENSVAAIGTFDSPVLERSDGSGSTRWTKEQLWQKAILLLLANPWGMLPRVALLIASAVALLGAYGVVTGVLSIVHGTFLGVGSILVAIVLVFSMMAALQIVTLGLVVVLIRSHTQNGVDPGAELEVLEWQQR